MINFIQSAQTFIAWEYARVMPNSLKQVPIDRKNQIIDSANVLCEAHDIIGLSKIMNSTINTKHQLQSSLDNAFFKDVNDSKASMKFWNNFFLINYIIGSVLISLRWILINFLKWPSRI